MRQTDANLTAGSSRISKARKGIRIVQNKATFDYDNWLPNLQFRYDVTDNSVLRFAFTGTIGRPQYEKAAPIARLKSEEQDPDDADRSQLPIPG